MHTNDLYVLKQGMKEGANTREIWRRLNGRYAEDTIRKWRRDLQREGHPENYKTLYWTEQEIAELRKAVAENLHPEEIAQRVGRPVEGVKKIAVRLKIKLRNDYEQRFWSQEEHATLLAMWHDGKKPAEIAAALNRPVYGVIHIIRDYKLRRGEARDVVPCQSSNVRQDCFNHLMDLIEDYGGAPRAAWEWSGPLRVAQWQEGRAEYKAKCELREEQIPLSDSRPLRMPPERAPSASYIGSVALMCADFS